LRQYGTETNTSKEIPVIEAPSFNPATVRDRFPALGRQQNGKAVIYFDNPAGTQVPQDTIDGFARYLTSSNANVHGTFATSRETDEVVDGARQVMADFLNASPGEIVFGPNMTTLTFALSRAIGRRLRAGDEIVLTRLEHDANISPWLALRESGAEIRFIDIDPEELRLDLRSAEQVIGPRTRLVAVGYASNAFGTINDVKKVTELARAQGAWVFVDAVHYGPHGPIDVDDLDVDFLACSSYKFFGPHLGTLYGRRQLLEEIEPYHVRPAGDVPPSSWETGTQSHEALSGLLGTMAYIASLATRPSDDRRLVFADAMRRIKAYERTLAERLIAGMLRIRGVSIYGITDLLEFDHRVPTVAFAIDGKGPHDVAQELGAEGVFSWAGHHYALEPMSRLNLRATNRIGLVHYNTVAEIDRFLTVLEEIAS
jgi:cysteine desulfurase family protein (TIGR01976 family)